MTEAGQARRQRKDAELFLGQLIRDENQGGNMTKCSQKVQRQMPFLLGLPTRVASALGSTQTHGGRFLGPVLLFYRHGVFPL